MLLLKDCGSRWVFAAGFQCGLDATTLANVSVAIAASAIVRLHIILAVSTGCGGCIAVHKALL